MRAKCHADCASHYPATGFISPNTVTTNNPYKAADENRHHFLTLVGTLSEERQVRVAAYTLMTNHFHLFAVDDRAEANTPPTAMPRNAPPVAQLATFGSTVSTLASRKCPLANRSPLR